jgi:hypothetical protein
LQTGMTGGHAMLARMLGQQSRGLKFLGVTQLLGFLTGQRHRPGPRFSAQRRAASKL